MKIEERVILNLINDVIKVCEREGYVDRILEYAGPVLEREDVHSQIAVSVIEYVKYYDPTKIVKRRSTIANKKNTNGGNGKTNSSYFLLRNFVLSRIKEVFTKEIQGASEVIERRVNVKGSLVRMSDREFFKYRKLLKKLHHTSTRNITYVSQLEDFLYDEARGDFFEKHKIEDTFNTCLHVKDPEALLIEKEEVKENEKNNKSSLHESLLYEMYKKLHLRE